MSKYVFSDIKERLISPCLLDIMDDLGYRNQGMSYDIRPLVNSDKKLMGPAYTLLASEVYEVPDKPYKNELEAIDQMEKGDVIIATTQGSMCAAFFGELMCNRCHYRGVEGAVIDGATRDTAAIEALGFPLFCRGISPLDSKGRMDVIAYQVPIKAGGVTVNPGDVVFADRDGIAVIPADIVERVIDLALKKLHMEDIVRDEILQGISATDVYNKYHVL